MMAKIKVGLFGAARGMVMFHMMAMLPEVELTAVCDMNPAHKAKADRLAQECGNEIKYYTEFEEFIKHDMDAVILANFATEHAPYAIRLLNSGRHVLSEIPIVQNIAQSVELIEAVEKSGCVYAASENYCYMDDTFEMHRLYQRGDIGEFVYGEGAYIHDWANQHAGTTAGNPNHWRNLIYSTFYCTHSIIPFLFITGLRPVSVTGFETNKCGIAPRALGYRGGGTGIEMVTLENGGILRSIHGGLKREPWEHNLNYTVYGTRGCMETHAIHDYDMSVYREGKVFCKGENESYTPHRFIAVEEAAKAFERGYRDADMFHPTVSYGRFHRGGDFYPGYFFIQKILGREEGKYSVDVYTAVDGSLCGILAYRSILNGNIPMTVPNFRNKEEREAYRNDRACTDPEIAGDQVIPCNPHGEPDIPDEVYEYVKELWRTGKDAEHRDGEPE